MVGTSFDYMYGTKVESDGNEYYNAVFIGKSTSYRYWVVRKSNDTQVQNDFDNIIKSLNLN